ncbi:hypothetical protein FVQ98_14490 [Ottowia sp. GY511]|uniref:XRE family transcriptional regulator n=1 Tax=Ottowia flava TaxID=2675430 RepID=A0ABW4KP13_9BURK|nr:hypothetical protein [Ottowia sp. GY511]TXK26363.1 hypothetical protein FVQ98_14490 [Ottowia sp. GY511]
MNYTNQATGALALSIHDVRAAHPNTSIPDGAPFGDFVPYAPATPPAHDPLTQWLVEVTPVDVAGTLTQQWVVVDMTEAEVAAARQARVPHSVTRRQARQALLLAGLLDQVEPAIAAIADPTQRGLASIEWADSQAFERSRPLLIQLASALGLDSAALDNLFIQAAQL